jgi:hypothetical protein
MSGAERPSPAESKGMQRAAQVVAEAGTMPPDMARDFLEGCGCVAIHYMRAAFGDDYTRGWLEHALSDLDRPPLLVIRKRH